MALITANTMNGYSFIKSFFYDPTNGDPPPTILRSWFPVQNIWDNFYTIYAIQFYIMWLGIIFVPCWHLFIVTLMIYCISYLKILNYRLENFEDYLMHDLPKGTQIKMEQVRKLQLTNNVVEYDKKAVELFKKYMREHQSILTYIKELSGLISVSVFVDFIIFSILLCALLFQTSYVSI